MSGREMVYAAMGELYDTSENRIGSAHGFTEDQVRTIQAWNLELINLLGARIDEVMSQ